MKSKVVFFLTVVALLFLSNVGECQGWVPYVPSSADLRCWVLDGISYVNVSMTFGAACYEVDWETVVREQYEIWVDSKIWAWEGACPLMIITLCNTYSLGRLEKGNYSFTFMAWNETVKSINFAIVEVESKTWTVDDDGPADFSLIREAIDNPAVMDGDTILVHNGTYIEDVVVNKSISLIGENRENTIIYGSGNGTVVYVSADNVNVSRFTIRNSGNCSIDGGICLNNSQGCSIDGNRINVEGSGIIVSGGYGNHLVNNRIGPTYSWYGIYLINSSENMIIGNVQSASDVGIKLVTGSCGNNISGNHITYNVIVNIHLDPNSHNNSVTNNEVYALGPWPFQNIVIESEGNAVYHNNFFNGIEINGIEEPMFVYHANNVWDNGYPSGGNYWSAHNPPDVYSGPYQNETGRDRIGDIPYVIDENNTDRYPLIYPYGYVPTIDLNNDGVISITDIVIVALAFGSKPGDPNWNPYADLNQDGKVTITDVVMIALHFGET